MFGYVVGYCNFELMVDPADVVLHPLLALGFDLLEGIELHLVLLCEDKLLPDVVLLREFVIPEFAPHHANVAEQREAL
jgi:hypothetical protein